MTNSEEPSAPDGISSMKVSESFGTQDNQHSFGTYGNGELKGDGNGGDGFTLSSTSTSASAYSSSSSSSSEGETGAGAGLAGNLSQPGAVVAAVAGTHQHPQLPFTLICGEELEHKTEVSDGILVLTNYRLFLQSKDATYNIPLGLLESVECRDIFFLHVNCKDARCIRCTFPNNEAALDMLKRIQTAISSTKEVEDGFAFTFFIKTRDGVSDEVKAHLGWDLPPFPSPKERFDAELKRMEFNVQGPWRVSDENKDYELCNSYPTHIIVPCVMDKKKLEKVACFRSARRVPAVVWRHKGNGAVISRCSQPEVGWFGWRSAEDEELVQNIVLACADNGRSIPDSQTKIVPKIPADSDTYNELSNGAPPSPGTCNSLSSMEVVPEPPNIKKLLILDARSYSTAVVNRARGGGCECLEYYTNCEIQFMNLANIHSIRKSFINVRQLCALPTDQANNNWFSQLESCKWLQHMSGLMKAAVTVATAIEHEGRPVMVHCSDGWDRTPQIVALAEILLDPYYRSIEGFQVLVEREWLDFGHKFADRCGQGVGSEDTNERCPVFLQWLDCLHQLMKQFPTAFEFNLTFLIKLAQHTYSNLFGTFLCNTAKERYALRLHELTHSVWRFLRAPANYDKFRNHLYTSSEKVLWPRCEVRELKLWNNVYLGFDNPSSALSEVINPSQESSPAPSVAADNEASERISNYKLEQSKARSSSCENLHLPHAGQLQRRKSDPSLSDSVLGIDSEEVENRCLPIRETEKVVTAASTDVEETANSPEPLDSAQVSQEVIHEAAEPEELSENEDTETTSEEKSESTVVNFRYMKSIESSTDTLVAENGALFESSTGIQKFIMEVPNKTDCNELDNGRTDILRKTETEKGLLDKEYEAEQLKEAVPDLDQILENQQCEVCANSRKLLDDTPNPTGGLTSSTVSNSSNNGASVVGNGSKMSSYNTPMHSRTPSFGIPSTPEDSLSVVGKSLNQDKWTVDVSPPVVGPKPTYDVDGLEPLHDEVQSTMNVIISGYKGKIDTLQKELQMYREALMNQVCHKCTHLGHVRPDDAMSVADSLCSVERQSVGQDSHSSEISWEAVDEKDTRPPLWIPDFATTKCMGCSASFWLGLRKHHCRACGKIFCSDCSEFTISIPSEQLFTPVRVCSSCYYRLSNHIHQPSSSSCSSAPNSDHPLMNGNGHNELLHHNGVHHDHGNGSTVDFVQSSLPNGLSRRRLSEELPKPQHQHTHVNTWGLKLKTTQTSSSNSSNEHPLVDICATETTLTNGHSSFQ